MGRTGRRQEKMERREENERENKGMYEIAYKQKEGLLEQKWLGERKEDGL